jgi:hypothetical protein
MTDDLTAELARLQSVEDLSNERKATPLTVLNHLRVVNYRDAIALANKLHAENERLKALLVECEKVVKLAVDAAENFPDVHDGRVEPLQMIEHLHEWEAEHLGFGKIAGADDLLTKLHAAGIGGE